MCSGAKATSWADLVEEGEKVQDTADSLGNAKVTVENEKTKVTVQFTKNEEGKTVKIVRYYRIEKIPVPKPIARRKKWSKYGLAANDPPGPNPANTIFGEEIYMQFLTEKKVEVKEKEPAKDPLAILKGQKLVKCQICKDDHWTKNCPYKDKLHALPDSLKQEKKEANPDPEVKPQKVGKYVPPNVRERMTRSGGDSMGWKTSDQPPTIRITNLPEDTQECDMHDLFRPFGTVSRIYLAKDRPTGLCRGFAFVTYLRRSDAENALSHIDGHGYENLILHAEWAKSTRD